MITVTDANDLVSLDAAYAKFRETTDKPTLIIVKSIIGFGAPNKQDTSSAHGSPLGDEEIALAKESYGWKHDKFAVPEDVIEHFQSKTGKRGAEAYAAWSEKYAKYAKAFPAEAAELEMMGKNELPAGWEKSLPTFDADAKGMASRASSGKVLNAVAGAIPFLIGGSADLAGSVSYTHLTLPTICSV